MPGKYTDDVVFDIGSSQTESFLGVCSHTCHYPSVYKYRALPSSNSLIFSSITVSLPTNTYTKHKTSKPPTFVMAVSSRATRQAPPGLTKVPFPEVDPSPIRWWRDHRRPHHPRVSSLEKTGRILPILTPSQACRRQPQLLLATFPSHLPSHVHAQVS